MSLRDDRWFRRDLIYFADSGIQGTKSVPVPEGGPSEKLNHCVAFVSEGQAPKEKIKPRPRPKTSATCRPVGCLNPGGFSSAPACDAQMQSQPPPKVLLRQASRPQAPASAPDHTSLAYRH